MKKINWLPLLCTLFLFSLFFIENIPDYGKEVYEDENLDEYCQKTLVDLEDFEAYLVEMQFGKISYTSEELIDTTGDGELEMVRSHVSLKQSECLVSQEIIKNGAQIWKGEIRLNKSHLTQFFRDEALIAAHENEALLYLGLTHSNFIEALNKDRYYDDRSKRIVRFSLNDEKPLLEAYNSELKSSIDAYKGRYIFDRNPGHEAMYMWDENNQSFVLLCDLQKEIQLI